MSSVALYIAIGAYFAILMAVLAYRRRTIASREIADFTLGYKNSSGMKPAWIVVSYAATWFSAFTVVGIPGFVYANGVGVLVFLLVGNLITLLVILIFGRAIWRLRHETNSVSPIEIVQKKYGSRSLSAVVVTATVVFIIPHLATQFVGIGRILAGVVGGGIGYAQGVGVILLIMLVYSGLGGFRAVVITDAIQFSVMIVGMIALVVVMLMVNDWGLGDGLLASVSDSGNGALLSLPGPAGLYSWQTVISQACFIGLWPIAHPSVASRFLAAPSEKTFKWMALGMAVVPIVAFLPGVLLGLGGAVRYPGLVSGDLITGSIVDGLMAASPVMQVIGPVFVVAAVAAAMSTCDSQALAIGTVVTRDYKSAEEEEATDEQSQVRTLRWIMWVTLVGAFVIGLQPPRQIVTLSLLSGAGTAVLVPTYVGLFTRRPSWKAALASIAVGYAVMAVGAVFQWAPLGFSSGLVAIVVSACVFFIVQRVA